MRICLDASPAVHLRGGIGRYTQELAAALVDLNTGASFASFFNLASQALLVPPFNHLPRLGTNIGDRPWRTRVLLAYLSRLSQDRFFPEIDLFHATDHLLPLFTGIHSVFTVHDLTFLLYPQTHRAGNRLYLRLMMPRFLAACDAVIAVSKATRRDLIQNYPIDPSKVKVVPEGVSARFHPASTGQIEAVRRRYNLPGRFLLYAGTIEPRKNLVALLEVFHALQPHHPGLKLVIAGKMGWHFKKFLQRRAALDLEGDVLLPGFIADEDLPALYSAASLFLYPSLYEGFGLPVLEAMACGTPVVCSNTSSLPEVAGEAALLVSPQDIPAMADAVQRILMEPDLVQEMRRKGMQQAKRFSWEHSARQTFAIYRQALAAEG